MPRRFAAGIPIPQNKCIWAKEKLTNTIHDCKLGGGDGTRKLSCKVRLRRAPFQGYILPSRLT